MQWRVIVRMSLTGDTGSGLRNTLSAMFDEAGVKNTGTGLWESAGVDAKTAAETMARLVRVLADPNSVPVASVDPSARLNHLWIYIDQAS